MALRSLALINEQRGDDAIGLHDSNGFARKLAGSVSVRLHTVLSALLAQSHGICKWIAGHTRQSTCLNATKDDCAHPFRFFGESHALGCHNGIVDHDYRRDVDSEEIFARLAERPLTPEGFPDYSALSNLGGYWAIQLSTGEEGQPDQPIHFHAHENTIAFGRWEDAIVWSSSADHLKIATGIEKHVTLKSGHGFRLDCDSLRPRRIPGGRFLSTAPSKADRWAHYRSITNGGQKQITHSAGLWTPSRDDDGVGYSLDSPNNVTSGFSVDGTGDDAIYVPRGFSASVWRELDTLAKSLGYYGMLDYRRCNQWVDRSWKFVARELKKDAKVIFSY
jgi:hypothetical protein